MKVKLIGHPLTRATDFVTDILEWKVVGRRRRRKFRQSYSSDIEHLTGFTSYRRVTKTFGCSDKV